MQIGRVRAEVARRVVDGRVMDNRRFTGHIHGHGVRLTTNGGSDRRSTLSKALHNTVLDNSDLLIRRGPLDRLVRSRGRSHGGGELGRRAIGEVKVDRAARVDLDGVDGHGEAGGFFPRTAGDVAVPDVGAINQQTGSIHMVVRIFGRGIARELVAGDFAGTAVVEDDTDRVVTGLIDDVFRNLVDLIGGAVACAGFGGHQFARPSRVLNDVARCRVVVNVHIRVDLVPSRRLLRVSSVADDRVRILLGEGLGGGDLVAVCVGTSELHRDLRVDRALRADCDLLAVGERAGIAFGRGVACVVDVTRVERDLRRVGLERLRAGHGERGTRGVRCVVEDVHLAALNGARRDLLAGDGELATIDLIDIFAVVEHRVHAGEVLVTVHVHHGHAVVVAVAVGLVTLDHQAVVALAVTKIFSVAFHRIAELVDVRDFRMLPLIIARVAKRRTLREARIRATGADRTVEEQRSATGTGADNAPAHADLPRGQLAGVFVRVGIGIVRFDPSHELVVTHTIALQTADASCVKVLVLHDGTHETTVLGSSVAAAVRRILIEQRWVRRSVQTVVTLEDLAVLVLRAVR